MNFTFFIGGNSAAVVDPGSAVVTSPSSTVITTGYTEVTSDLYYSAGYLGTLKIPALNLSVKVYQGSDRKIFIRLSQGARGAAGAHLSLHGRRRSSMQKGGIHRI